MGESRSRKISVGRASPGVTGGASTTTGGVSSSSSFERAQKNRSGKYAPMPGLNAARVAWNTYFLSFARGFRGSCPLASNAAMADPSVSVMPIMRCSVRSHVSAGSGLPRCKACSHADACPFPSPGCTRSPVTANARSRRRAWALRRRRRLCELQERA